MTDMQGRPMDLASWDSDCAPAYPPPHYRAAPALLPDTPKVLRSHLDLLTQAIEAEVIPRLLGARKVGPGVKRRGNRPDWVADRGQIDRFVELLLDPDETLAVGDLRALLDRGVALDALYATLMTQAARRLGEMWEEDEVKFTVVTTAVWRMQQILRVMSTAFVGEQTSARTARRSILLVPAIGEQHSFGLAMVAEFFRKAGWQVCCEIVPSNEGLAALLHGAWYDVIGFSVGGGHQMEAVTKTIRLARGASRNRRLGVMVGGPAFVLNPGLVADVGADATAGDAAQATVAAARLVTTLAACG